MKRALVGVVVAACSLAGAGCMSERYAQHHDRRHYSGQDTVAMMTKGDVIALSKAKVSDDVIVSQIKASRSYFQLSTQDIIDLANAGISDNVIDAMINTDQSSQQSDDSNGYYSSPPYYWYSGYPFWYPWYQSLYLGFSVGRYRPLYGYRTVFPHVSSFGHHGFYGGRGSGGVRSAGRHR